MYRLYSYIYIGIAIYIYIVYNFRLDSKKLLKFFHILFENVAAYEGSFHTNMSITYLNLEVLDQS